MKILFASLPQPKNRFVQDLKAGIERYAEVIYDFNEFWKCQNHYDVIHIHEPEYLSFEIQSYLYNTKPFSKELWNRLDDCLKHWSKNSTIIHTRHVQEPHVRVDNEFRKLYKHVMSYCHGVAHFAKFSIQQFKECYPDFKKLQHVVIPHQNYASHPNNMSKAEARKKLKIRHDAKVMLVFGMVKEHEKVLIKEAFDTIQHKHKVLLAPRWGMKKPKIGWIRLREWVFKIKELWSSLNKTFRINLGFIDVEHAQLYLNAADVLFIPRMYELNSGNIALGFTFGLVVVGKDSEDIGEILNETGNPTFKVGNKNSLNCAMQKAFELVKIGYGEKNRSLAITEWDVDKTAKRYIEFYGRFDK